MSEPSHAPQDCPPIFCINLKRAVERRQRVEHEWVKKRGFEITFVDAFDRRELAESASPIPYDSANARKVIRRGMSAGEIACVISHIKALRAALSVAGESGAVIMEDDALPLVDGPSALATRLAKCRQRFPAVRAIMCHKPYARHQSNEMREGCGLLAGTPNGAIVVWYSFEALSEAIGALEQMRFPTDWLWSRHFVPAGTACILTPAVARHDDAMNTTYIGNDLRRTRRRFIP